ncbi:hypothetical protein HanRHA438_Chr06g0277461 [Helianthus annuus]|nr:hypothetical protein HanRHA438_Chr06g0277461 [Helianthus annuus]
MLNRKLDDWLLKYDVIVDDDHALPDENLVPTKTLARRTLLRRNPIATKSQVFVMTFSS